MRLKRRLADAIRSPARLAAFVRRVGEVAWRGELIPLMRRVRPRGPTVADYRAWSAARTRRADASIALPPYLVALDAGDDETRAMLAQSFANMPASARAVLVRGEVGGWRPASGGDTQSLQWFARMHGVSWIWWIADVLALDVDAPSLLSAACTMPGARVVYADHDIVGDDGKPSHAEFKPAWDRVQVLECPYAGPLLVVHAGLAAALDDAGERGTIGQWRLLLDAVESLPEEAIVHVPQVVVHARETEQRDVAAREAVAPRIRSLVEARGDRVALEPARTPWLRYTVPAECTVSIVVPTRDRHPLLERCLRSVLANEFPRDAELVVVDNGSSDPRIAQLLRSVGARVRLQVVPMDVPFNFPQLCNAGVDAARGRIVVLLNNDCEVTSSWLVELAGMAARAGVGAVGPLLVYPDGLVQSAGVLVGVNRTATSALAGFPPDDPAAVRWCRVRRRVSAVLGACIAVARDKFRRVGGMDERFGVSHNEVDFCLRLEDEGLANVFTPFARVVHQEGGTRGFEVTAAERERLLAEEALFFTRWGHLLDAVDPAHHPALARTGNPFLLTTSASQAREPRAGWRAARARPGSDEGAHAG